MGKRVPLTSPKGGDNVGRNVENITAWRKNKSIYRGRLH